MITDGFSKAAKRGATALLLASVCLPALTASQARADSITDRIIQNVIQNILQDIRDQIQSRRLVPPSQMLRFSGEDANTAYNTDDPFAALAYAKAPYTKAPPMPPAPTYLYGVNLTGSGDSSHAAGITTSSFGVTGAVDITKIGIFRADDAISVIFTGSGIWSNSPGIDSTTGVGAGTIAYVSGGFSTDFTVDGTWTSTRLAAAGIVSPDSSGVSYAPNVQYKFELGNGFYIEPTVGFTYTQVFTANFGTQTGDSTEIHGGARFGTETMWNSIRVQPSLSLAAFSITEQTGTGGIIGPGGVLIPGAAGATPTGSVGGRASGKLNFLWTSTFSSFIEAHGSGIAGTTAYGGTGGLRWTF